MKKKIEIIVNRGRFEMASKKDVNEFSEDVESFNEARVRYFKNVQSKNAYSYLIIAFVDKRGTINRSIIGGD